MLSIKTLKKQKEDDVGKIADLKGTIAKYEQTIEKLKNDLAYARDKNDDVYIKFHEQTLKLIPLEKDIYEKSLQIAALSA